MARTYYIDPRAGDDSRGGLEESQAIRTYERLSLSPGDTVLFRRGSVIRGVLHTCDGETGSPITYGAYGDGPAPTFLGSASASDASKWTREQPNLWRFEGEFPSEVCNLIFNGGESCGNLRWSLADLKQQGEWYFTGIGVCSEDKWAAGRGDVLYLFSESNPGEYYSDIECALWGQRKMVSGRRNIVLQDLAFRYSGVHGYQDVRVEKITIRRCEFRFIGGAVWSRPLRIRFGNAVEMWDGATDVTIEDCIFDNIYDSGVTHQGSDASDTPRRVYFRNNLFIDNGMAAYEWRGPAASDIYFEHNTCIHAGGGFSMQGETPPRQSEIYPQPMGHHVFIWRLDKPEELGPIYIRDNIFYEAPYGAAIYSIIDPVEEKKFVIDRNCYYQTTNDLLARIAGRNFRPAEFREYQAAGFDAQSLFADPKFVDAKHADYRLAPTSPCKGMGRK
ncbi:MAG: right-handed parallel beta-helix repeat-containing protein [Kiritimatiellae bacterium]|nr:right-handed parallel beta-helix repeat-containing protein [Kiritimatiellia bacterium]